MADFIYGIYTSQKNTALKKARGNFDSMCILDNNAQIELQWWEYNINTFNIIGQNVLPNIEIFSDACLTGWGAAYDGHSTGGHWSVEESKSHLNVLEKKGALFALKIYCKGMYKFSIHFKNRQHIHYCLDKQADSPKQRNF